jgi:hypothetical protein
VRELVQGGLILVALTIAAVMRLVGLGSSSPTEDA